MKFSVELVVLVMAPLISLLVGQCQSEKRNAYTPAVDSPEREDSSHPAVYSGFPSLFNRFRFPRGHRFGLKFPPRPFRFGPFDFSTAHFRNKLISPFRSISSVVNYSDDQDQDDESVEHLNSFVHDHNVDSSDPKIEVVDRVSFPHFSVDSQDRHVNIPKVDHHDQDDKGSTDHNEQLFGSVVSNNHEQNPKNDLSARHIQIENMFEDHCGPGCAGHPNFFNKIVEHALVTVPLRTILNVPYPFYSPPEDDTSQEDDQEGRVVYESDTREESHLNEECATFAASSPEDGEPDNEAWYLCGSKQEDVDQEENDINSRMFNIFKYLL